MAKSKDTVGEEGKIAWLFTFNKLSVQKVKLSQILSLTPLVICNKDTSSLGLRFCTIKQLYRTVNFGSYLWPSSPGCSVECSSWLTGCSASFTSDRIDDKKLSSRGWTHTAYFLKHFLFHLFSFFRIK